MKQLEPDTDWQDLTRDREQMGQMVEITFVSYVLNVYNIKKKTTGIFK